MKILDIFTIIGVTGGTWITLTKIIPPLWKSLQNFFGWKVKPERLFQTKIECTKIVELNKTIALQNQNRDNDIKKQLEKIIQQMSALKQSSEEGNLSLANLVGCSKDLLRQDFDHIYNVYVPLGYLPENIRAQLIRVYENYESLNGNGSYAEMFKQLIALPPAQRVSPQWRGEMQQDWQNETLHQTKTTKTTKTTDRDNKN